MELSRMHEALSAAYAEVLDDPRNQAERLEDASCGPHVRHLSEIAAAAAAEGLSADQWRTRLLEHAGASAAGPLDAAEVCMRHSGLWPWHP